jgi:methionyl-tRNA formyltransferase
VIKVLFFGTPQFAVPTLQALLSHSDIHVGAVITQPDRPVGRGGLITAPPIKQLAEQHSIPVFQPTSIRKEFSVLRDALDEVGPFDLGVVVAFGQILPTEVLHYPRQGCVNIHGSLLPRWRGAAPIQRAIEAGDPKTGVCLMNMDEGLDTGAVFSSSETKISEHDTTLTLQERLAQMGADLLLRDIQAISSGALTAVPQAEEGVTYAKKISSAEALIAWTNTATTLSRQIRAFSPQPGSYTLWQGRRLKILRASEAKNDIHKDFTPGVVCKASTDGLVVQCGQGALSLEEVQLEGKKKMLIAEFMRGTMIAPGTVLGK